MQKINRRLTSKVAAHIGTQHIETIDFLDHEAERAVAIIDDVADELAALMKHHPVLIQHHVSLVLETLPKRVGKSLYDSLLKCGERSAEGVAIALVRGLPPAYLPMDITTQESVAGGILKAIIGTAAVAKQAVKFVAGKEPVVTKQSFKKKLLSLILEPIKKAVLEKIVLGGAKAIAWLMRHVRTSISPQRIARIIIDGISKGYDRVMIARELRNELGATKAQAKRIARTEGARVATESNMAAFEELGEMVLGYLIHSVLDERTRPQHRARNGTIYYKEPTGNQKSVSEMPRPPIESDGSIAWNCRCVTAESYVHGHINSIIRTNYAGQFLEIRTRSGAKLVVTANHPIATDKGFVPANCLNKGSYVVSDGIRAAKFPININDSIPTIKEMFETLAVANGLHTIRRIPTALEFHGDGAFINSEISIVWANRRLMGKADPDCLHGFRKNDLVRGASLAMGIHNLQCPFGISHPRPFDTLSIGRPTHLNTSVEKHSIKAELLSSSVISPTGNAKLFGKDIQGITGQISSDNFGGGFSFGETPSQPFRFHFRPDRDAIFNEASPDNLVTSGEFISQLVDRHASQIAFDEVISINRFFMTTHVYSIDSGIGYYMGSDSSVSIVQGNCYLSPVFEELDDLHVPANAEGSLIPNVLVYQDWFKRATERQRRIAVGTRRYDLITSKHGKDASYYYYIQDNGDLIPLETAKRESPKDTQDRVHAVRLMAQANRRNRRDVLATGQV